jgi:hypothetical protein
MKFKYVLAALLALALSCSAFESFAKGHSHAKGKTHKVHKQKFYPKHGKKYAKHEKKPRNTKSNKQSGNDSLRSLKHAKVRHSVYQTKKKHENHAKKQSAKIIAPVLPAAIPAKVIISVPALPAPPKVNVSAPQ